MPNATIVFTNGKRIRFNIDTAAAPLTAANFISLAMNGFYDGVCFHRAVKDFVIQGGGFNVVENGKLKRKKAPVKIYGEFKNNGFYNPLSHEKGVVSMARRPSKKNGASSQFFICVTDLKYLDGDFAAFGKITDSESLKVAEQISLVATESREEHDNVPKMPIEIQTILVDDGV